MNSQDGTKAITWGTWNPDSCIIHIATKPHYQFMCVMMFFCVFIYWVFHFRWCSWSAIRTTILIFTTYLDVSKFWTATTLRCCRRVCFYWFFCRHCWLMSHTMPSVFWDNTKIYLDLPFMGELDCIAANINVTQDFGYHPKRYITCK